MTIKHSRKRKKAPKTAEHWLKWVSLYNKNNYLKLAYLQMLPSLVDEFYNWVTKLASCVLPVFFADANCSTILGHLLQYSLGHQDLLFLLFSHGSHIARSRPLKPMPVISLSHYGDSRRSLSARNFPSLRCFKQFLNFVKICWQVFHPNSKGYKCCKMLLVW